MAYLFVPISGQFAGGEESPDGQPLGWSGWSGLEFTRLGGLPDLWAAVSEAEMRDWVIGARFPLWAEGPAVLPVWSVDRTQRSAALHMAGVALDEAHGAGARYLVLPMAWPDVSGAAPDPGTVAATVADLAALAAAAGVQVRLALQPGGSTLPTRHPAVPAARLALVQACQQHSRQVALALEPEFGVASGDRVGASPPADWQEWLPVTQHLYVRHVPPAWTGEWAARHRNLRIVIAPAPGSPATDQTALRIWAGALA